MPLQVAAGQFSSAGRKPSNQDFHGACVPDGVALAAKGVAIALADGISSSQAGAQASQAAVTSFLEDYYCTPEAWSVKHSVERVLAAANSWLYAQTQQGAGRYDKDHGWVCTFSAIVIKGRSAHLFHIGDTRIWQLQGRALEQLTRDHRVHTGGETYLGRALGIAPQVEIDYRSIALEPGDTFLLATDGVYEHMSELAMVDVLQRCGGDLDAACQAIADAALAGGSEDNLTVQVLQVPALPCADAAETLREAGELALPPALGARMLLDGYRLVRELHASSRSHAWLAHDEETQQAVVIKVPATEQREDPRALQRLLLEEWVARRVDNAHVLKASVPTRQRRYLYTVMEYVQGQTLAQWMIDNPRPSLEAVRGIVQQIARGLRALHRAEMLHQDLRPENIMIDSHGSVKIIDFGAVRVAGLQDLGSHAPEGVPGMAQYMAPEYFAGLEGTQRSDLFSLAVISFQMLTGQLPYGMELAKTRSQVEQRRLRCASVQAVRRDIPAWVDDTLHKALHPDPLRRHADAAEFAYALQHPEPGISQRRQPLAQRDPLTFWRVLTLLLALCCVVLLGLMHSQ